MATLPTPSCPPLRGYKEPTDTNGALVLTGPLCEVRIPREDAYRILPGRSPVTAKGGSNSGYVYSVDRDAALKLLHHVP